MLWDPGHFLRSPASRMPIPETPSLLPTLLRNLGKQFSRHCRSLGPFWETMRSTGHWGSAEIVSAYPDTPSVSGVNHLSISALDEMPILAMLSLRRKKESILPPSLSTGAHPIQHRTIYDGRTHSWPPFLFRLCGFPHKPGEDEGPLTWSTATSSFVSTAGRPACPCSAAI